VTKVKGLGRKKTRPRASVRSLAGKEYVYLWVDGVHFDNRLEEGATSDPGATADSHKEPIAASEGNRESEQSLKAPGTVTYEFFTNDTGSGTPAATQTVTLNANGTVSDSAVHGPLAAGAYSAGYSGDSNYKGSTSPVEPLTINQGSTSTAAAILATTRSQPPNGVLGEWVFDTANRYGHPTVARFPRAGPSH
jgi:hypothetical protein